MTPAEDTVRRIYTALAWRGWGQRDLADALGVSSKTVNAHMALRAGLTDPQLWGSRRGRVSLAGIADALEVPIEALQADGPAALLVGGAVEAEPEGEEAPAAVPTTLAELAAETERRASEAALAQARYVAALLREG